MKIKLTSFGFEVSVLSWTWGFLVDSTLSFLLSRNALWRRLASSVRRLTCWLRLIGSNEIESVRHRIKSSGRLLRAPDLVKGALRMSHVGSVILRSRTLCNKKNQKKYGSKNLRILKSNNAKYNTVLRPLSFKKGTQKFPKSWKYKRHSGNIKGHLKARMPLLRKPGNIRDFKTKEHDTVIHNGHSAGTTIRFSTIDGDGRIFTCFTCGGLVAFFSDKLIFSIFSSIFSLFVFWRIWNNPRCKKAEC